MKSSFYMSFALLLLAIASVANADSFRRYHPFGYCSVLPPNGADSAGRTCPSDQPYAVLLNGTMLDGVCYGELPDAWEKMTQTQACVGDLPL